MADERRLPRAFGIFIDGIGTAAATSGVLSQLQGRIFGLLYLHDRPLSLDRIADELGLSKSNISINVRGLIDWHLVKRVSVAGSRRDHYEAATDFVRVMQEIIERRFRWNLRQVMATVEETGKALSKEPKSDGGAPAVEFLGDRLKSLRTFVTILDGAVGAFAPGQPFPPAPLAPRASERSSGARDSKEPAVAGRRRST